jgi:hypothetical protein
VDSHPEHRGLRRPQDLRWLAAHPNTDPDHLIETIVAQRLREPRRETNGLTIQVSLERRLKIAARLVAAAFLQGYVALSKHKTSDDEVLWVAEALGSDAGEADVIEAQRVLDLPLFQADHRDGSGRFPDHRRIAEYLTAVALNSVTGEALPPQYVATALGTRCRTALSGVLGEWLRLADGRQRGALLTWDPIGALPYVEHGAPDEELRAWFKQLVLRTKPNGEPWFHPGWGSQWPYAWLRPVLVPQLVKLFHGLRAGETPTHLHMLVMEAIAENGLPEGIEDLRRPLWRLVSSEWLPHWHRRRALAAWYRLKDPRLDRRAEGLFRRLCNVLEAKGVESPVSGLTEDTSHRQSPLLIELLHHHVPGAWGASHVVDALKFSPQYVSSWLDELYFGESSQSVKDLLFDVLDALPPEWTLGSLSGIQERGLVPTVAERVESQPLVQAQRLADWLWRLRDPHSGAWIPEERLREAVADWRRRSEPEAWLDFYAACLSHDEPKHYVEEEWLDELGRLSDGEYASLLCILPPERAKRRLLSIWWQQHAAPLDHDSLRAIVASRGDLNLTDDDLPAPEAIESRHTALRENRAGIQSNRRTIPSADERRAREQAAFEAAIITVADQIRAGEHLDGLLQLELRVRFYAAEQPESHAVLLDEAAEAWAQDGDLSTLPAKPVSHLIVDRGWRRLLESDDAGPVSHRRLMVWWLRCGHGFRDTAAARAAPLIDLRSALDEAVSAAIGDHVAIDHHVLPLWEVLSTLEQRAELAWTWLHRPGLDQIGIGPKLARLVRDNADRPPSVPSTEPDDEAARLITVLKVRWSPGQQHNLESVLPEGMSPDLLELVGLPFDPSRQPDESLDELLLQRWSALPDMSGEKLANNVGRVLRSAGVPPPRHAPRLLRCYLERICRLDSAKVRQTQQATDTTNDLDPDHENLPQPPDPEKGLMALAALATRIERAAPLVPDASVSALLAGRHPGDRDAVLLCFGSKDRLDVERLYDGLADRLGPGRVFMDQHSIPDSADWLHELLTALRHCAVVVLWMTREWLTAPYPRFELGYAKAWGARVFPIFVEPAESAPAYVDRDQGMKLHDTSDLADTVDRIGRLLGER